MKTPKPPPSAGIAQRARSTTSAPRKRESARWHPSPSPSLLRDLTSPPFVLGCSNTLDHLTLEASKSESRGPHPLPPHSSTSGNSP